LPWVCILRQLSTISSANPKISSRALVSTLAKALVNSSLSSPAISTVVAEKPLIKLSGFLISCAIPADKIPTDINALLEEFVNLAYHGMRAQDSSFNAKIEKMLDPNLPKVNVSPQSLGRVFLNLINNALYAINQKAQHLKQQDPTSTFMPTITVTSSQTDQAVYIKIKDNGEGISDEIQGKIFERFFTTKPAGHGTGLGLPICYDIVVKEHGGKLTVASTLHDFTEFTIELPKDK